MTADSFFKRNTQPGDEPSLAAPLPIPAHIGPYKIEALLERGGMSIIYLGTHPEKGEPIIIKVLSPKFIQQPEAVKRFLNEAEIIALADHPNIVKLYNYGEWENGLYIAMEFVQGITLRQYLLRHPLSLKKALEITIDIAYALCHLHTHGIIHRDLKPENILIDETESVKVIDFGIAQLLTEQEGASKEAKQHVIGTPIYMSPEQREHPNQVSFSSDIYSLGIITYELALGKLSHGQVHLSLVPKGLHKILYKTLQQRPEDRYQDIVDFIADLSGYLNSEALEKEKKGGDFLSDFSDQLKKAQRLLEPATAPSWPSVEIGIAIHKGMGVTIGHYHDFLELENKKYAIVLGSCTTRGAEELVCNAVLRGLCHSLARINATTEEFATHLNTLIIQDHMKQIFSFACLFLEPENNQARYISCGYGNLWKISVGLDHPSVIGTPNLALGIDINSRFVEEVIPWQNGDVFIINTFAASNQKFTAENDFTESHFRDAIQEFIHAPPQKQVESILRKIKILSPQQANQQSFPIISVKLQ